MFGIDFTVTENKHIMQDAMLDPLWTHLSGRVDESMTAMNELTQRNAQISECNQVPGFAATKVPLDA